MSIVYYPSDILLHPTKPINIREYGLDNIQELKKTMIEAMIKHEGIGLAANQIGLNIRACVMFLPSTINNESIILINPSIIRRGKDTVVCEEGCLSFPDVRVNKKRNKIVTVKYLNEFGVEEERVFKGIEAICAQHEIDHLDGITFVDELSEEDKENVIQRINNFIETKK